MDGSFVPDITKNKVPTSSDFLPGAVNQALFRHANNHWAVRYSIPVLAGILVSGAFFGFTYPIFLGSLSVLGVGTISWIYNYYLRSDKFKYEYVKQLNRAMEAHTEQKRKDLKESLLKCEDKRAAMQLEQFQIKFKTLGEVLQTKFDVTQLTYNRYYSIAQEVYLSGIDNLSAIVLAYKTIQSIDLNYINERVKSLGQGNMENKAVQKEYEALKRSITNHKEQMDKITKLRAENEIALTQMDETTIAISEIKRSKDKEAQVDMENSMKALQELAQRSKYYSR